MKDFKELREALDAGPTDGPWVADIPCATEHLWAREAKVRANKWGIVATIGIDTSLPHWDLPQRANAALIAAANPATIRSLLAELDEARRDAARYRWLRDVGDATWRPFGIREGYSATKADAAIDAAIDAAMKEQQP